MVVIMLEPPATRVTMVVQPAPPPTVEQSFTPGTTVELLAPRATVGQPFTPVTMAALPATLDQEDSLNPSGLPAVLRDIRIISDLVLRTFQESQGVPVMVHRDLPSPFRGHPVLPDHPLDLPVDPEQPSALGVITPDQLGQLRDRLA